VKIFLTATITCLATAAIGATAWFYVGRGDKSDLGTLVRVENPVRGDLIEVVGASGTIEPKTKVSISARVSSLIVDLPFREGQAVTKGNPTANPPVPASVLVRLDDKDLQAALRTAESNRSALAAQREVARKRLTTQKSVITGIRVALTDAQRSLDRETELLKAKVSAQAVVDTAQCAVDKFRSDLAAAENTFLADEMNLEAMQHTLAAAEAEVVRCKDNLTYTVIASPIDGTVVRVKAEVGEMAIPGTMNNVGTEIMQVADLTRMQVLAEVDEAYIGNVCPGQTAKVRLQAYPGRVLDGVVDSVALMQSLSRTGSKYFETRILANAAGQKILSGLTADVDIQTSRHAKVMKVPSQAVLGRRADDLPSKIRDGNPNVQAGKTEVPVVYRFIDGQAVVTPVTIGAADSTCTEILSGLSDADRVIVGPYKVLEGIHHEQKVRDDRASTTQPAGVCVPCTQPTTVPAAPAGKAGKAGA
jgi:HlyD family secretion protein